MMNELKIFSNSEFGEVRTVVANGEPMFCLSDICRVLEIGNSRQAKTRLKADGVISNDIIDSLGRTQSADFINESNLYRLVFQSRKENAEKFTDWVTSEVLPSIRRHGLYAMDELLENPDIAINALLKLKEEKEKRKALEIENKVKDQQIAELKPKATYYDLILQCKDLISMTEIAKDYGMSAKGMNAKLHELGVQFKQSGVWFLYAKYQDKGYTQTKTQNYNKPDGTQGVATHMYWTQKGRLFLYDLLKANGILPMIERNMEVA